MLYACGPNAVEEGTFTRVNEPALEIVGPSVEIICGAMLPPSCEAPGRSRAQLPCRTGLAI